MLTAREFRLAAPARDVFDKISWILDAGGNPHEAVREADLRAAFRRHRRMRHRCRMRDQRLDAAQAFGQRHQPDALAHVGGRLERADSNVSIPPKPLICRFASSCCGCEGSPGYSTCFTFGCACRYSASAWPFTLCCAIRSASVFVPRRISHESNGLRIAPAEFWMNFSHSMSSSRDRDDDPADAVAVAVQILGRAVDDEVGAELDRTLQARACERVVDDHLDAWRCASSHAAARSVSRITGLVGVSMNSIFVSRT